VDTTLIALADRAHPVVFGLVLVLLVLRPVLSRLVDTSQHVPGQLSTDDVGACPDLVAQLVHAESDLRAFLAGAFGSVYWQDLPAYVEPVTAAVAALQAAHNLGPETPAQAATPPDADQDAETVAP